VARLAVSLGLGVAEDLAAVGVDDDDALPEVGKRRRQTIAVDGDLVARRRVPGLRPLAGRLAPQRTQPNLPVM
jgi:hypothetical protein